MTITLYAIPNCDTVKKARAWLDERGIAYRFHDYKKAGVPAGRLDAWIAQAGADKVLNRAGLTFRRLPDDAKQGLDDAGTAALLIAHPSAIKRPIVEYPGGLLVGFDPAAWEAALG
jgi:arsenate reductase (glutaredoxin)